MRPSTCTRVVDAIIAGDYTVPTRRRQSRWGGSGRPPFPPHARSGAPGAPIPLFARCGISGCPPYTLVAALERRAAPRLHSPERRVEGVLGGLVRRRGCLA